MTSSPNICSLQSLEIQLEESILRHLESQYNHQKETTVGNDEENNKTHTSDAAADDDDGGDDHMGRILSAMKRPPAYTTCRVNFIRTTRQEVLVELQQLLSPISQLEVQEDQHFPDVINIIPTGSKYILSDLTGPISDDSDKDDGDGDSIDNIDATTPKESDVLFSNWPLRKEQGWPIDYRSIICDRFCGEAVLRGSDIFVRGVLAADSGIRAGEKVAVYADIPCKVNNGILTRGLKLEQYRGKCIYLGLGIAECDRNEIFKSTKGKAVTMSMNSKDRSGPMLPPLSGVLQDKMMLQNLPSIFVGHAINPCKNDIILDMCMAPGGKTLHLASLVRNHNQTLIVACDKSRKKVVSAKELFIGMGATCITPLVLDATNCCTDEAVGNSSLKQERKDIYQILREAPIGMDGLREIKKFNELSFDKIVLDPPCSALGLRPKLFVAQKNLNELEKHVEYQKKFVAQAIKLLKVGGCMSYSTCTINGSENEGIVSHILQTYPLMELVPIELPPSQSALEGYGLSAKERNYVRRFDPSDSADTMGFFLALFRKRS